MYTHLHQGSPTHTLSTCKHLLRYTLKAITRLQSFLNGNANQVYQGKAEITERMMVQENRLEPTCSPNERLTSHDGEVYLYIIRARHWSSSIEG